MQSDPHGARGDLLRATSFVIFLMVLCVGSQSVHADDYGFVGGLSLVPAYGAHGPIPNYSGVVYAGDDFTESLSGSFGDAANWEVDQYPYVSYDSSGNGVLNSSTSVPGPGDSVGIGGLPAGSLAPTEGPGSSYEGVPIFGYYTAGGYGTGLAGYSSDSFNVSGVGGTIANLTVSGPGTLGLSGLTATTSASFSSEGGLESLAFNADWATDPSTIPLYQFEGFSPSAQVITGGSLSTPSLTLSANTNLAPAEGYGADGEVPDPAADAGSLTIQGATLSGDVTQVLGVPAGTTADTMLNIQPVTMTSGATLNAKTELDIVGADPTAYPSVTGTTTLSANASTITSALLVIATGTSGYGSGAAGAGAELDLAESSTVMATTLVVGDTGDGTLNVTSGSTITDQQAVIGNATDSTGAVTIDGSTWINNGYLSVGNNGLGTLTIQNGGQVTTTGQYGNIYIAGLAGSSDSSVTVTGSGSLLQSSGYFVVAQDGTGDGTGTLTVEDQASVVTGDVMYVGEVQGATGTVDISGGATVTNNTTGTYGTSSTVLGVVAGSYGYLYVDGTGSQLESTGDMSIGYSGDGTVSITDGGALIVDGTLFRIGRNEGSTGSLTIDGQGSSVTASSGTIYIGYGGNGTVEVEDGANLSVMATNIGGQSTGIGELDIDDSATTASLGDVTVGDGGEGTLNITDATVNMNSLTIGAVADDAGYLTGNRANVIDGGAMVVGNQAEGTATWTQGSVLNPDTLTVGEGDNGDGTVTINTGASMSPVHNTIIANDDNSTGTITVDGTGSLLAVGGDLTVAEAGEGYLTVSNNATVTNQNAIVGDAQTGDGTVEVTGMGSVWHSYGTLTIAQSGTAQVTVDTGGTLRVDGDLTIGNNENATGTLTVDGANTQVIYGGGDVTIGASGSGTLILQNSAYVDLSGNSVTLGDQETGSGGILVTDNGTILNTGALTIGSEGYGELTLINAATLSTGDTTIGDEEIGSGVATITDAGTTWTTTGLTVGGSGTGTLNISDGGSVTVNAADLAIGDEETGDGTITLDGADSTFTFNGELQVGEQGTGLLAVQDAGSFTAHSVVVGDMPDSQGTINIDGMNTKMEVQTDFNIGEEGEGTVNITHNAKLISDADATIADQLDSTGAVVVDTLASWSVAGTLTVGGQSDGTLTIKGGSNVSSNNVTIGDQSSSINSIVTVTGTSPGSQEQAAIASELQFSGVLAIGNSGGGTLYIQAGASVDSFSIPNPPTVNQQVDIGVKQNGLGYLSLSGSGSSLSAQSMIIGDSGTGTVTQADGTIVEIAGDINLGNGSTGQGTYYQNGGSVSADSLHDGTNVSINAHGYYNLANDGVLNVTGFEYVGYNGLGSFSQSGTSTNTVGQSLDVATYSGSAGTYTMTGGTLTANAIAVNYNGLMTITGGAASSTNPISVNNKGVINVNGGTLTAPSLVNSVNGARVNFLSTANYHLYVKPGSLIPNIDLQINNTYIAQTAGNYCGPACMEMVLNSPAVLQNTVVAKTQKELYDLAEPGDGYYTSPVGMADTLGGLDNSHIYDPVVLQNGDTVSRDVAESLMTTNVPASVLINNGNHWIDVYGVSTTDVAAANQTYSINGFYVKDPWYGYALVTPNQPAGITPDTFLAYNTRSWFNFFNPTTYGIESGEYVAVVASPVPSLIGNTASNSFNSVLAPPSVLPGDDLTLSGAIEDGDVDLADDPALADEFGFTGGAFNTDDAFFVSLASDTNGEGDWVIPYEGAGGADDVTGVIAIDDETGTLDEANWIESGQDPMLLFQLQAAYDDQFSGNLPDDNNASVPEPASTSLLALSSVALLRRRRHIRSVASTNPGEGDRPKERKGGTALILDTHIKNDKENKSS